MSQEANSSDAANLPLAGAGDAAGTPPAPTDTAGALARVMGFHLDALPANRAGQMTGEQASTVVAKAVKSSWVALFMIGLLAFFLSGTTVYRYGRAFEWTPVTRIAFLAIGSVLVLLLLLVPVRTLVDARSRRVLSVEGALTKRLIAGRGTAYVMRVNQMDFVVPKAGFDLLPDGGRTRIYYTPLSQTLLNIEPL